ncbi:MAG: S8 family serine peptidase [Bacteroidetes bacterium]|nr:S8 family serine peptidase [Bacteroidota bacterium]
MKRIPFLLTCSAVVLSLSIASCDPSEVPTSSLADSDEEITFTNGEIIPDQYIVVLKDQSQFAGKTTRQVLDEMTTAEGVSATYRYETALLGFAAKLSSEAVARLEDDPLVDYIERDRVRHIFEQTVSTGVQRIFADDNPNLKIDGTDDYRVDVDVAIIDTGIDFEHPDLNVIGGVNCSGGGPFRSKCKSGGDDDHYHGTHVAGTVGGLDNGIGVVGVAPGARLWAVKVLDKNGSGWVSWIVAGIDWIASNADIIEVANMSLGGSGYSQAEYDAIQGTVDVGVAFAVAAGNSDADASNYSPAAFDNVLTVSALADFDGAPGGLGSPSCRSDEDDTLANFSNWGNAVQITAPGVCIFSTFPIEQGSYGTISGTSMASPHAAGALALLASSSNPNNSTDVYSLYGQVINSGNFDWTDDSGDGIWEPLLDVSDTSIFNPSTVAGTGGGGETNSPPTASFTYTCVDLICDFDGSGSSDSDGSIASYNWNFGDGNSGNGAIASHTYASDGTYTVTLTVTDDYGADDSASQDVSVTGGGGGETNSAPTASFTYSCTDLSCNFDGTLSSDDVGIASYDWDFGDLSSAGSGVTVSHTYGSDGTYTVTLTVTDNDGADDNASQDVLVSSTGGGGFTLSATGYKAKKGLQKADLEWSGATSTNVDVWRDGTVITTTANDGAYTDNIDKKGRGSYTYKLCEAGTSTCSNEATVVF